MTNTPARPGTSQPIRRVGTTLTTSLKSGMSDNDIMRNFGWKSRQMLARYAAANADERAREAHRRLSPGDRV